MNILFTFNTALILALDNLCLEKYKLVIISSHDKVSDRNYLKTNQKFYGFNGAKFKYFLSIFKYFKSNDLLIIGHINLAIIGYLFKLIYPKKR